MKDKRIEEAKKKVADRLDCIIDSYAILGFVEITGKCGGDIITYRVYDNGMITER